MSYTKITCVLQGDVRRGTQTVIDELSKHVDVVILSTWIDDKDRLPEGDYELILNEKPENRGVGNRNLQRYTTAKGILHAEKLGCDYVLKWRTDMLPTRLNIKDMIKYAQENVQDGLPSRIVTCTFRNLSVNPDWFSSIPDLFSFGAVEMMKLLWCTNRYDYKESIHSPRKMTEETGAEWLKQADYGGVFCNESELYALFRVALEQKVNRSLNYPEIARKYLRLINDRQLGVCWFHKTKGFRAIKANSYFPWWTQKIWSGKKKEKIIGMGYPTKLWWEVLSPVIDPTIKRLYRFRQSYYLMKYNIRKRFEK